MTTSATHFIFWTTVTTVTVPSIPIVLGVGALAGTLTWAVVYVRGNNRLKKERRQLEEEIIRMAGSDFTDGDYPPVQA